MARPERNNVDYFPFYCEEGKKMYYLEETYGNDGFAVFLKILRELAKTDYHYLDLSKKTTLMFLSAKCKVDTKLIESIIIDLVELEKFDSLLWNENKIIWCQDFIDSIQDAYSKRKNKCVTYEGLLHLLHGLGVRKLSKSKSTGGIKTQSIVKYSKVEEIKEENKKGKNNLSFSEIKKIELENWTKVKNEMWNSHTWINDIASKNGKTFDELRDYMAKFGTDRQDKEDFKQTIKEFKNHFLNWLRIEIGKEVNHKLDIYEDAQRQKQAIINRNIGNQQRQIGEYNE